MLVSADLESTTDLLPGECRLAEARPGQRLRVSRLDAGRRLHARLISMGLPLGSEVEILHNRAGGVVVAVGAGRLVIGRGMAKKLIGSLLS